MINKVVIKNFQSHKNTDLSFGPNLNAIVGENDQGKSAILRALRWVFTNRPRGETFIRDGEKECSVGITLDNGTTIERIKGKGINQYVINGEIYEAFGGDVPEPVLQILNLLEINQQNQHDGVFLLTDSPGKIAEAINSAVHLENITIVQSVVERELKNRKHALKEKKNEILAWEEELQKYKDLDKYEKMVKKGEYLEKRYVEIVQDSNTLTSLLDSIKSIKFPNVQLLAKLEIQCNRAEKQLGVKESLLRKYTGLSDIIKELDRIKLPKPEFIFKLEELVADGNCFVGVFTKTEAKVKTFTNLLKQLKLLIDQEKDLKIETAQEMQNYMLLESSLTICPLCGQILTEQAKEILLKKD